MYPPPLPNLLRETSASFYRNICQKGLARYGKCVPNLPHTLIVFGDGWFKNFDRLPFLVGEGLGSVYKIFANTQLEGISNFEKHL